MAAVKKYPVRARLRSQLPVLAFAFLLAIACAEQVQFSPTPTAEGPVPPPVVSTVVPPTESSQLTETVPPAPDPPGAELDPTVSPTSESAGSVPLVVVPTNTPPPTPEPTSPPVVVLPTNTPAATESPTPPPFHFLTQTEAEIGAIELGCSGWNAVEVDGVRYYRSCASADRYDELLAGAQPTAEPVAGQHPTATIEPTSTPDVELVPTSEASATPAAQVDPTPTPPPYHYSTVEQALAGAEELGCSGWAGLSVEGTSYFRACGDTHAFEILSAGGTVTISGDPCTLERDATARFSAAPTDLSQIASIVPAGSPPGGVIKPHSYLHNKDLPNGRNVMVPVYAVADSVLTSVGYYTTSLGTDEYLIFFDVTCEISYKYDHIAELAPKLAAVAPQTPSTDSSTARTDKITLKAGELIGYANGAGGQGAWDFGAYDTTFTNQFANQERYIESNAKQSIHTVCPYDYFEPDLKSRI